MNRQAFDTVRGQIGVCGIWCGSCAVGNGALCEVTRRYSDAFDGYGVEDWAPPELDYEALSKSLSIVAESASCLGCRQGGGPANCEMKTCARGRNLRECRACEEVECPHYELLASTRRGALDAGLFVKTKPGRTYTWLKKCAPQLKNQFPGCVLSLEKKEA